jgi:hypothetical protein
MSAPLTPGSIEILHDWANMRWLEANEKLNAAKILCDADAVEKHSQNQAMFRGVLMLIKEVTDTRNGLQELFASLQRIDATLKN